MFQASFARLLHHKWTGHQNVLRGRRQEENCFCVQGITDLGKPSTCLECPLTFQTGVSQPPAQSANKLLPIFKALDTLMVEKVSASFCV